MAEDAPADAQEGLPKIDSPTADAPAAPAGIKKLATMVSGCRDDVDGESAKKQLVQSYVEANNDNILGVLCQLHGHKVIVLSPGKLLKALTWKKGGATGTEDLVKESSHPGLFLANVLANASPSSMEALYKSYVVSNPNLDQIALLHYVNTKGFLEYGADGVLRDVSWLPPQTDEATAANWRSLWGRHIPEGTPWYATVRDQRGNKSKIAFLGSALDDGTPLAQPSALMLKQWKVPSPNMCICVDGGSMHPRQCDSINRMANLPQFHEWVAARLKEEKTLGKGGTPGLPPAEAGMQDVAGAPEEAMTSTGGRQSRVHPEPPMSLRGTSLSTIFQNTMDDWEQMIKDVPTDELLKDGSINSIIFTKLKEVFAALVDAATLAGSWIIVDRTDGSGSATAELLLEMALERGAQRPTILVIDSLERLGLARDGARAHKMLYALRDLFEAGDDVINQSPNGSEREFSFDFRYSPADFEDSAAYEDVEDHKLPFEVLADHQRKAFGGTCDPNRKWRYFYVDAIFKSGTHIVIKNNDRDAFVMDEVGNIGFLYAHGDTRTYKRLRANIQAGRPSVMLHNSGGVVTAFSFLQRVMAFQRPPPEPQELEGPLRFLISNLSRANWTHDFGTPEIIMMRSLAERAPMLFKKNIISVDIMTQSEEEVLEAITGCFAQAGGVPELGLGNAEVNVVFNTWMLHLTLCENARSFHRLSLVAQWVQWILAATATFLAVLSSSFGSGIIAAYIGLKDPRAVVPAADASADGAASTARRALSLAVSAVSAWQCGTEPEADANGGVLTLSGRRLIWEDWKAATPETEQAVKDFLFHLNYAVILVPILLALVITVTSRMAWRDKWSICIMAADQLASEIYKFRLVTCEYDVVNHPPGKDEDGNDLPPRTAKMKATMARDLFVTRVQAFYSAVRTELSQTTSLMRSRVSRGTKRPAKELFVGRAHKEEKPTLAQWWKLKCHLEQHFNRTSWAFPQGVSFLTWMAGLRPYLSQRTMREEMRTVIEKLVEDGTVVLHGTKPLSEYESNKIRRALAQRLGLPPTLFDSVKDELRILQRTLIIDLARDPNSIANNTSGGASAVTRAMAAVEDGMQGSVAQKDSKNLGSPADQVRDALMELQGQGKPKSDDPDKIVKLKKKTKQQQVEMKPRSNIEDDYLAGALTVDTYVAYRVRPVMDMFERRSNKLSRRLTTIEIMGFFIQSSGAVLAVFEYTEWVAMTVAIAAVLQGLIEFMNLRNQLTSVNIALKDLEAAIVYWDSLSIVRRRTNIVKMQLAMATESALLTVVNAHTTASSNTISSVDKQMAAAADREAAEEDE